jgi:hypothetical protein
MLLIGRKCFFAGVMVFAGLCATAQTVTTNGGTTNSVPKFSGSTTIVNSAVTENNGKVGIGTASPQATLHVAGNDHPGVIVEAQDSFLFGTTVCCGAGPTGSSIASDAGWSAFYNGLFFNSNGTSQGGGAQLNASVPSWRMALGSGVNEWPGGDNFVIARVPAGGNYAAPSILLKVDAGGALHSSGGIVFPDGSLQTKAQVAGPQGPQGPVGPQGPAGPRIGCSCSFFCNNGDSSSGFANNGITDCKSVADSFCTTFVNGSSRGGTKNFSCP